MKCRLGLLSTTADKDTLFSEKYKNYKVVYGEFCDIFYYLCAPMYAILDLTWMILVVDVCTR